MNDKKAHTRERILAAASTALIARGPIEPSVNEIMGAAGLTVRFLCAFRQQGSADAGSVQPVAGRTP